MRKIVFLLLCPLLVGCAADETAQARADALVQSAAAASGYVALAEVQLDCGDTAERYTLSVKTEGEETRVCVLAPEALGGVTAVLRGNALAIEYEGLALDGASLSPGVCAANCVPLALSALCGGELCERGEEDGLLRLAFLTGDDLRAALYFDADNALVAAELEENGQIAAQMQFTSFTFGAIIEDGKKPQG